MDCPECGTACTIDPASGALSPEIRITIIGNDEEPSTCRCCGTRRVRATLTHVSLNRDGSFGIGWMETLALPDRDKLAGGWN